MTPNLKSQFLLDPEVIFLNHGSFGACPHPVFEVFQDWQRRLERQPVRFLGRELPALELQARQALGAYLHASADDLVFVPNATHGVNIVAHSLKFQPGDEILTSDHEYGACDNAWDFALRRSGAVYRRQPVSLPFGSPEAITEQLWAGVTPRTRLIYLSHITSPTALRLPVEAICRRARQAGILTLIDGAHAPGQLNLDLAALGADFYTGNCHKWLLAPKGAAFLYARPDVQALIEPLVVSWGYSATPATSTGSRFIDLLQWTGTHDPAAALSVPAAIQFIQSNDWPAVRRRSAALLDEWLPSLAALANLPLAYAQDAGPSRSPQMAITPLPFDTDPLAFKRRLYEDFHIEIPVTEWAGRPFLRLSVQAYNDAGDLEALCQALDKILSSG